MQNKTFTKIYKRLEEQSFIGEYPHKISDIWQVFRDERHSENDSDSVKIAQIEMDVFNFAIRNNKLIPMFSGTDKQGNVFEVPALKFFDETDYKYIIKRLKDTKNIILLARYSHLLWLSPKKHEDYAKIAVENYIKIVKKINSRMLKGDTSRLPYHQVYHINNLFLLSKQIKYMLDEVLDIIIGLIKNYKQYNTTNFFFEAGLIQLINSNYKIFKEKVSADLIDIMWDIASTNKTNQAYHPALDILDVGKELQNKMGIDKYNTQLESAIIYELLLELSDNKLEAFPYCQIALSIYIELKNEAKIKELNDKIDDLRKDTKLHKIETPIDVEKQFKYGQKVAESVVKLSSDDVIIYLANSEEILPNYPELEKAVKSQAKSSPLIHLAPKTVLDQSGNPIQYFYTDKEKFFYHILENYEMALRYNYIYIIHPIIYLSVRENKLDASILLNYLNKNSWIGKTFIKKVMGNKVEFNWSSQIGGSLIEYFAQLKNNENNQNQYYDLVTSIDSLTLKIEGLIRDLCRFKGINTFFQRRDKRNNLIMREKDINWLLREKKVQKMFKSDDLLFFRFLLVEKRGYNLRHKVAHSLMHFNDYTIDKMHLLFICLLKISMYDFIDEDKPD